MNENQGAESTLAFLMARVEMRLQGEVDGSESSLDLFGNTIDGTKAAANVF